jgi:hypothetical protein
MYAITSIVQYYYYSFIIVHGRHPSLQSCGNRQLLPGYG